MGPDVFGYGMHRLITIIDGGGAAGEFERLQRLFYGHRGRQTVEGLIQVLMGANNHEMAQLPVPAADVTTA